MTFSLHAFSSSDTAFDVQAAALEDPRPHPTEAALVQLGQAMMTELLDLVGDGALEAVQTILAESLIGAFHSAAGRIERDADRARDRMRVLERDFDGSELADSELQAATQAARAADVAQLAAELIRDAAAEVYATATGETWTPWRGSRRGTVMTAAQLEAKAALRAMQAAKREASELKGPVVAFRAAPFADTSADASRIFDALGAVAVAGHGAGHHRGEGCGEAGHPLGAAEAGHPGAGPGRLRAERQGCAVPGK